MNYSDPNPRFITVEEIRSLNPKAIQLTPIERPESPTEGLMYADAADHNLYYYDGSEWQKMTFSPGT